MASISKKPISVRITHMNASHISEVRRIEEEAGLTVCSEHYWLGELISRHSRALVAEWEEGGEVMGYIHAWFLQGEMQITEIAVKGQFRKRGIATLLIKHLIGQAKEEGIKRAYLEVRTGNEAALNLYRKMGFSIQGRRPGYYRESGGEDAFLMVASI